MKLGSTEPHQLSVDMEESLVSGLLQQSQQTSGSSLLSGSPPQSGRTSPPVTPSSVQALYHLQSYQQIALPHIQQQHQQSQSQSQSQLFLLQSPQEPMELQLEYWPSRTTIDKDKSLAKVFDQGKCSIKGTFRSLQVTMFIPRYLSIRFFYESNYRCLVGVLFSLTGVSTTIESTIG